MVHPHDRHDTGNPGGAEHGNGSGDPIFEDRIHHGLAAPRLGVHEPLARGHPDDIAGQYRELPVHRDTDMLCAPK